MRLREHGQWTKWEFHFKDLKGEEIILPGNGEYANSHHALAQMIKAQFDVFDTETNGQYTEYVRKEAQNLNLTYIEYLHVVIEHQICLRHGNSKNKLCWDDGLGDRLHEVSKKIDHIIEAFPAPVKAVAQTIVQGATKAATGKASKKLGSCRTCGGSTTFDPQVKNLGRAGALNNLVPNKVISTRK